MYFIDLVDFSGGKILETYVFRNKTEAMEYFIKLVNAGREERSAPRPYLLADKHLLSFVDRDGNLRDYSFGHEISNMLEGVGI